MSLYEMKLHDQSRLLIDVLAPDLFRLRYDRSDRFQPGGMQRYRFLKLEWPECAVQRQDQPDECCLQTTQASLTIKLQDGNFELRRNDGSMLLQSAKPPHGDQDQGFELALRLQPEDRLYGLGDETRDRLNKRGHQNRMAILNVSAYTPIPFLSCTRGWALYLNSTWIHRFDGGVANPEQLCFSSEQGLLECFLFVGKTIPELLQRYVELTGPSYLLPRWSYGMTYVCDERGVRARDVLYEAYEFRRQGIPCDVIGLEPDWMEKRYDFSTEKQWSQERFHIPAWLKGKEYGTFSHALHRMGFKLSLWLCCDYDLSEYEELCCKQQLASSLVMPEKDATSTTLEDDLFKDPHFFPVYQDKLTKSGESWFEHLRPFVDDGADAFKMDGSNQIAAHPDRLWKNGMTDAEMHNLYPLLLGRQMSQGFSDHTGRRAQIFTPSGHAGIQHYAAIWAGDTGGGAKTVPGLLNLGLSGQSNVCTDMQVHNREGIHYGFFQALAQGFSWHMYNQPWFLGDELLKIYKDYALLRHRLIPYIYSAAYEAHCSGMPIMRAMPLIYPDLPESEECLQQYFFGPSLLLSAFAERLFLPPGFWYDFWTDKLWEGPAWIPATYPADRGGCLFVRAGAAIPMQNPSPYVGTITPECLIWHLYPGTNFDYTLYEDDGISFEYQQGKQALTQVSGRQKEKGFEIEITARQGQYQGMPAQRQHQFVVHPQEAQMEILQKSEPEGIRL
ncbi:MAG: TIM-barrel domain-containing protein, partial [Lentisphaeria bacterium]